MNKLATLFLLSILWMSSSAQDNRVNNPIQNFDELWSEFNLRYANFDLISFSWEDKYKHYRKQINKNSTNDELFYVCCSMLQELEDRHVSIHRKDTPDSLSCGELKSSRFFHEFQTNKNVFELININDSILKQNKFCEIKEYQSRESDYPVFQYAFSNDLGFLRINGMAGYSKNKLNKIMSEVMDSLSTRNGLIIDVRLNGGGYDKIAYNIAGYFADKKRVGHHKKTRIKGSDKYTKLETTYLIPQSKKSFRKPIILLTSDWTVSAADVFVMAMKEIPGVKIVGDNTSGFFSDMYEFKLSNKWQVSLSHQKYFDAAMKNHEKLGVEPNIKLLNTKANLIDNNDPLLIKALELLKK